MSLIAAFVKRNVNTSEHAAAGFTAAGWAAVVF